MAKANGLDYDKAFRTASMVKYSSLLFIASMFCLTVSCIGGAPVPQPNPQTQPNPQSEAFAKELRDSTIAFITDLTDLSGSSNVFVKIMLDMADGMIEQYDKDKKQIQSAVTKGTEMGKKIQSVLQSLKNSSIPLTKELQEEIDAIGKHATSEVKKLKGMENLKDIEGIEKEAREKYTNIKGKIQELFNAALTMAPKDKGTVTEVTENDKKKEELALEFKTKLVDLKTKLFALVHTTVPVAFAVKNNEDAVSKKMETTYTALSEIRSDFNRVEQIQYNLLRSCKAHSGADVAFLSPSSLKPFVFAILLGMLF